MCKATGQGNSYRLRPYIEAKYRKHIVAREFAKKIRTL